MSTISKTAKPNDVETLESPKKPLRFQAERVRVLHVRSSVKTGEICLKTCAGCCRTQKY